MTSSNQNNGFIKQAGILAIAGIICRMIGMLYRSPLTAIIGDDGNGYYSSAYNIYAIILLVSSYSIPSAISKEISLRLALKEYKNAQRVFHCAIIYVIAVGGIASLFTFFCAGLFVGQNSIIVLKVFAPTIFLSGLLGVLRGYFQAHKTMLQTSISQILEQIFNAVISILSAYFLMNSFFSSNKTSRAIYGAAGSAVGTGAGVLIALIFMWSVYLYNRKIIIKRIHRDITNSLVSYKNIFIRMFQNVTPMLLSTFIYNLNTSLNQTIYSKISIFVKGSNEEKIALQYGIFAGKAIIIANIPIGIASAMSSAIIPSISSSSIQGDMKETNQKIDTAIRTTMLIILPSAVGLAVLSRPVVQLLFPQRTSIIPAANLLCYLSISIVFYSLSTLTNAVLQAIGKPNIPVFNALVSLIIQTVVLIILLSCTDLNLYALAIAAIIYSIIICLLNGISVRKYLGYRQNIKKNYLLPLTASALMGAVAELLYKLLFIICSNNVISLFPSVAFSIVIYFVIIIRFGGLNERELLAFPDGSIIVKLAKKIRILS